MKHWGKITGAMLAMLLAMASLQAQAATKAQDREFNHMSTGFPLIGVHATTACETCHVGGVFVGTPRACDGCHAVGKRVVATPKSTKHIVTDAPCESCHFNTSTFFGARYNHGTAVPGQCTNCHNGRITAGMPTNHPVTNSACDNCHRSSAWIPASWNHRDTASDCSLCHTGSPGRTFTAPPHISGAHLGIMGISNCRSCHKNYYSFYAAYYDHAGAAGSCDTCHGSGVPYTGVVKMTSTANHTSYATVSITCTACHKNYVTFLGARYDHAGAVGTCDSCHGTFGVPAHTGIQAPTAAIHGVVTGLGITTCSSCHTTYSARARFNHAGVTTCASCHSGAYTGVRGKPVGHLAYIGTPDCNVCHTTPTSWGSVTGLSLHTYLTTNANAAAGSGLVHTPTCRSCHSGSAHSDHNGASADCSSNGCHDPVGTKGSAYRNWD